MCSRPSGVAALAIVVMAMLAVASAQAQAEPVTAEGPGPAEIKQALDRVRADPNLGSERTIKTLHWRGSSANARPPAIPGWLAWIAGLFRWLDQSARTLLYGALVVLAGMLVVYISRTIRRYRGSSVEEPFVAPTHVRNLDIRPESLPGDIGAAARQLWDRGEHRAALALLYRGLLSRLAHVHRVPIRDSSTEGDCLGLASTHLAERQQAYISDLVRVWQRSVYGGQDATASTVHGLCDRFASSLDRVSSLDATAGGGAA